MPRAVTCMIDNKEVSVEQALRLRDDPERKRTTRLNFQCIDCGKQVKPHKEGKASGAHFEHHRRNPNCPLSDPAR